MLGTTSKTVRLLAAIAAALFVLSVGTAWSSLSAPSASAADFPDLVVAWVALPSAFTGAPVTFAAVVKNVGTAATPDGVTIGVQFQVDRSGPLTWSDTDTASLAPGKAVRLVANGGQAGSTWTATTGSHVVRAWVDDVARIGEADDVNNQRSTSFTIAPGPAAGGPDLVVTSISAAQVASSARVTFSATVANLGTDPTPDGVVVGVQFEVDGSGPLTWSDTDRASLAPGASVTLAANGGQAGSTWTATVGTHVVRAWVDDVARIAETNEANNVLWATLVVSDGSSPNPPTDPPTDPPTTSPPPVQTPSRKGAMFGINGQQFPLLDLAFVEVLSRSGGRARDDVDPW